MINRVLTIVFFFLFSNLYAGSESQNKAVVVDFFMSSTCNHCHEADHFLKQIETKYPWLRIRRFVINKDVKALEAFDNRLKAFNLKDFSVPTFFFCKERWVGFDKEDEAKLISAFQRCKHAN